MRIIDSALHHGITVQEITTVIAYPEITIALPARIPGAHIVLAIGALDENQPYIEVIYDLDD